MTFSELDYQFSISYYFPVSLKCYYNIIAQVRIFVCSIVVNYSLSILMPSFLSTDLLQM